MVAITDAIVVVYWLSIVVVAKLQRECVLEFSTNSSHDVYCDVIPYEIDLSPSSGLTTLDLSRNNLTGIHITSDKNVTLTMLDLSENDIHSPCHVLISDTVNVDSMVLIHNNIKNFSMCSDMRNLTLSWNSIESLTRVDMTNASSLEVLDLGHNFILWIENDTFSGMPDLQWLDLRGNALMNVAEKTLPGSTLRYLDVSDNLDLGRSMVFQPFENLVELKIAGNAELASVVLGFGPRLQALDASRTNLTEILASPAPLLGSLVLSGNAIRLVNSGDLDGFPLLRLLNISDNQIGTVEDDAFGRLDLLVVLDLSGNLLTTVPKSLPGSLETLNLESNRIENLVIEDFEGCKRLKTLNMRNNSIRHIQDFAFSPLLYLDILDLSENPIEMITREMLTGPVRLKALKLDGLAARETPTFPFTDTRYLNRIHLSSSGHLASILLNDTAVLSSMFQLEYLDLTGCAMTSLPNRLPYYMPKMKVLIVDSLNCSTVGSWLKEWMCEIHASGNHNHGTYGTGLRLSHHRPASPASSAASVRCTLNNGELHEVFDVRYCASITTASPTFRTPTTEQVAVFARLRAKTDLENSRAVTVETSHPGVVAFLCIVLIFALLACGSVWIGTRANGLGRLHWRQDAVDIDYQNIEIKSLESLNHVERW